MKIKSRFAITFLLFVILSPFVWAADTHTAASCKQADVLAAINLASDGDTVLVPPGTEVWTVGITINNPPSITLKGAGPDEATGTVIENQTVGDWGKTLLWLTSSIKKGIKIEGFRFIGNGNGNGSIHLQGFRDLRITNCSFRRTEGTGYMLQLDSAYGVIDHCNFTEAALSAGDGRDEAWTRPYVFGSRDASFIEDCTFEYSTTSAEYGLVSGWGGCRFVFRFNKIINGGLNNHESCTSDNRGGMVMEVYENTFTSTKNRDKAVSMRGGTGVVFNNIFMGDWFKTINSYNLLIQRAQQRCPDGYTCVAKFMTQCDNYPCLDQLGRQANQFLDPVYIWNNPQKGQMRGLEVADCDATHGFVLESRDYYNQIFRPGYIPYPYPHPLILADYPGQQRSLDLIATKTGGQINLTWKAVTGAVSYSILRNWQQVVLVTGTNWSDSAPGSEPVYMVYALNESGKILAAEGKVISAVPQSVSLASGWNWVSFNVLPTDLSLNSVFAGILSKVEQVKTQTQSVIRSNNAWKGDLVNMNGIGQYKMFKVKVTQACTLTVTGIKIAFATAIELKGGWNWVAYLPTTAMPIATALASINGQVQEVKSLTQTATYSGGAWSGTLTQLDPGQGYAIKMSTLWALAYPAGQ